MWSHPYAPQTESYAQKITPIFVWHNHWKWSSILTSVTSSYAPLLYFNKRLLILSLLAKVDKIRWFFCGKLENEEIADRWEKRGKKSENNLRVYFLQPVSARRLDIFEHLVEEARCRHHYLPYLHNIKKYEGVGADGRGLEARAEALPVNHFGCPLRNSI